MTLTMPPKMGGMDERQKNFYSAEPNAVLVLLYSVTTKHKEVLK